MRFLIHIQFYFYSLTDSNIKYWACLSFITNNNPDKNYKLELNKNTWYLTTSIRDEMKYNLLTDPNIRFILLDLQSYVSVFDYLQTFKQKEYPLNKMLDKEHFDLLLEFKNTNNNKFDSIKPFVLTVKYDPKCSSDCSFFTTPSIPYL